MNASNLKGIPVVTYSDATKVGTLDDVLFDRGLRHVVGFRVRHGLRGPAGVVRRDDVVAVDATALSVPNSSVIGGEDRGTELADAVSLDEAKGTRLVTESGTFLGTIGGIHLDIDARDVISYTLAGSLLDRLRHIEPSILARHALRLDEDGTMIVDDAAAQEAHAPAWEILQGYSEQGRGSRG
jgi:sporulation protein YlmC with PRC-barrel domain